MFGGGGVLREDSIKIFIIRGNLFIEISCRMGWIRQCAVTLVKASIALALYCIIGAVYYTNVEEWTVVQSVYFCVVTMSTVGYGDFSPSTPENRTFTVIMIFAGVIFVFTQVAKFFVTLSS